MSNFNIKRAFKTARDRNWDKVYWLIDVHGTICKSDYANDKGIQREFFPGAKETLQELTRRADCCLILWTCSWQDDINDILSWLKNNGINMDHVNVNPEVESNKLSNFQAKIYCNVILDDKAGFEGETDWVFVRAALDVEAPL